MKKIKIYLFILIPLCSFLSCKKFVVVPPPLTELVGESVFNSNNSAESALNGIYLTMAGNSTGGGPDGLSVLQGLSADELSLITAGRDALQHQAYNNSLLSTSGPPFWADMYNVIYQANAAIGAIPSSTGMTPAVKNQLTGEALFIRAFCYFYLTNLYGNVPLVTSVNYKVNQNLPRAPQSHIYQQIVADLLQAQKLLTDNYLTSSGVITPERVRPNKEATTALLARVYLYTADWHDAVTQSSAVISSSIYTINSNLNNVFLVNSTEAIWQLELPVTDLANTPDGPLFVIPLLYYSGVPNIFYPLTLSDNLAKSFEPGDLRKINWIDSAQSNGTTYYYPYKYKLYYTGVAPQEYPMMLRFAEQYLIRSEAEAQLGQIGLAINDLNVIRNRAGLPNYNGLTDKTSLLSAILHERRVELFTENGHRWLDLKRTGTVNSVMGSPGNACASKGGIWNNNWQLYPIPLGDIQKDASLTQNPGYN